ncbi:MAG: hypothetical protein AVDCRST_MAG29-846, partial [uncultured Nocardioidaceae bacterium]
EPPDGAGRMGGVVDQEPLPAGGDRPGLGAGRGAGADPLRPALLPAGAGLPRPAGPAVGQRPRPARGARRRHGLGARPAGRRRRPRAPGTADLAARSRGPRRTAGRPRLPDCGGAAHAGRQQPLVAVRRAAPGGAGAGRAAPAGTIGPV